MTSRNGAKVNSIHYKTQGGHMKSKLLCYSTAIFILISQLFLSQSAIADPPPAVMNPISQTVTFIPGQWSQAVIGVDTYIVGNVSVNGCNLSYDSLTGRIYVLSCSTTSCGSYCNFSIPSQISQPTSPNPYHFNIYVNVAQSGVYTFNFTYGNTTLSSATVTAVEATHTCTRPPGSPGGGCV